MRAKWIFGGKTKSTQSKSSTRNWKNAALSKRMLSVFVCACFLLILAGQTGVYNYIYQRIEKNNRTPHALNSNSALKYLPAAGTLEAPDKTKAPSEKLAAQLAKERDIQQHGKPVDQRHVKLLADHRTENSKEYLNADGSKSLVYTAQASSYKDADGNWHDVDNSLVKDKDGSWHTKANSWTATFGKSNDKGISLSKDGQTFTFKPASSNNVSPTVSGNAPDQTVTYKDLWRGVDLQYEVSGSQVKENIIVKDKSAATGYGFNYSGANLLPVEGSDGTYKLDGAFAGFTLAAPTARTHDNGIETKSTPVKQQLVDGKLVVNLDSTWLKSQSDKAFPIVIDPTVFNVSVGSSFNNFTNTGFTCGPGQGCGNSVGYDAVVNNRTWRFIYQVSVPSSPGQYLASAKLHVEMPPDDGIHDYGVRTSKAIAVDHAGCTNSFSCIDGSYGEATGSVAESADIEMASIYRNAVNNGDTSPWMIVKGEEGGGDSYKSFDDAKTKVTFTYETLPTQSTIATGAPVDDGSTATTQPIIKSKAVGDTDGPTDPDGPGPYQYRYVVGTGKSLPTSDPLHIKQGVTGVVADSGLLPQAQWVVPENVLQDGKTYYWQPIIWDSFAGAAQVYGPVYSFKVDLRDGKDATQSFDAMSSLNVNLATGNLTTGNDSQSMKAVAGDMGVGLDYNSPQKSSYGLIGQYWNDPSGTRTFPSSTAPALTRTDPNIAVDWSSGSPYAGVITSDNFLVRWSGYFVAPQAGTYQFGTTSDDRSRIFINGSSTAYVDGWSANPTDSYGANVTLTAGQVVPITYEYAEITGNASAQLLVKTTDGSITPRAVPTDWLQTGIKPVATPHGLIGRYYTDDGSHNFPTNVNDPSRIFLTRTDTSMNLNWGTNAPVPNGPTDNFMVRWTGFFTAPVNDTYTFGIGSDDGGRIIINGNNTIVNNWSDHGASPISYASSGVALTKGQTIPITIEYHDHTGGAQMGLYAKQASLPSAPDTIVDTSWLTPNSQILPDGWNFNMDTSYTINYNFASINQSSVTLYDSEGETHEYQFVNNGFTPPIGETGHMVRNGDGTVTLQDDDGLTYVFNSDGTIKSVTTPNDDLNPAAFQYTYGSSNGSPAHLTQITDGVTTSHWLKLYYSGDTNCPTPPSGFLSSAPANMVCAAATSDGRMTKFFYANDGGGVPRLARVEKPGSDITDYGYDTAGRITQQRDTLANDAVSAGVRSQDGTELSLVTYDPLGRVADVTLPAATVGATRMKHTYQYLPGNTSLMHINGATEPNGFTRKVTYDGTYRTLTESDAANLATTTEWDPKKDLVLSSTDPAGLKKTNIYDYAYRQIDTYGPAPSSWYGTDRKPLTTPTNYTTQVPHTQTGYDEGINGLAAAYYNVTTASNGTGSTTKVLSGAPKSHSAGIGPTNGDLLKTWNGTPPFTPDSGNGWGTRLTGDIHMTTAGNYNFRIFSDDGVRLWIDDQLIVDDWNDGAQRSHATGTFNNTASPADSWHRVRLDYYNKAGDSDARLEVYMTAPGGSETSSIGSLLTPLYGLTTTKKVYDSSTSVGDTVTTTDYGSHPELQLAQTSTQDPTGLNLVTTNTYETQGASGSFLRQTSQALPGGATTNYTYYGASETRQNPCDTSKTYLQAGLMKLKTQPDPDAGGSQTGIVTEMVYDDAGRIVATRIGSSGSWICKTHDDRDRQLTEAIPSATNTAHVTRSARTVTSNYAVSGNPLVSSVSDASGTLTTTLDLLGRKVSYADTVMDGSTPHTVTTTYTYDSAGRIATKDSAGSTETYVYDNYNRLSQQKVNNVTVATPTYDSAGRLQSVAYNAASSIQPISSTVSRDSLGRENGYTYAYQNSGLPASTADSATLSQSGKITSETTNGYASSFAYDKAERLTSASIATQSYGTNTYTYGFGTPTGCTGTYNTNAGKDSNRTSMTLTNVFGTVTTNYCYDYADKLVSSTLSQGANAFSSISYDGHNNITSTGSGFGATIEYDSSDRAVYMQDMGGTENVKFDPIDRVSQDNAMNTWRVYGDENDTAVAIYNSSWSSAVRFVKLPGNVLLSLKVSSPTDGNNVYSFATVRGDVFSMITGVGSGIAGFYQYDPFGKLISGGRPVSNFDTAGSYGWQGANQKSDYAFSANFMQMGKRLYSPTVGRFAQMDTIEGGNSNSFIYPADPINSSDLSGESKVNSEGRGYQTPSPEETNAYFQKKAGLPNYNRAAANRFEKKMQKNQKVQGQRNKQKRGRDDNDKNNPTSPPSIGNNPYLGGGRGGNNNAAKAVVVGAGAGGTLWLAFKIVSPACGPFVLVCAAAF